MAVLGWAVCFAALGWFEMSRMWRKREIYEMWVFFVMLVAVTTYGILYSLDVPLPDPHALVKAIYGPIGERLMGAGS